MIRNGVILDPFLAQARQPHDVASLRSYLCHVLRPRCLATYIAASACWSGSPSIGGCGLGRTYSSGNTNLRMSSVESGSFSAPMTYPRELYRG